MSLPRKILLTVAILVVVFVVATGIFVATFDANQYRGVILQQLSRSVNRPVEAADLELTLLPLRLRLNQVQVKEDSSFAEGDFLRAQAVRFDFDLTALLGGEVKVEGIELVEPTLYLRQNAAGKWNVTTLAPAPGEAPPTPPPVPTSAPAPPPIRDWEMEKGTIVIERPGERPLQLTGVELEVSDLSLSEAFPFRLGVNFTEDSHIAAEGKFGPFNPDAPAQSPLDAEVELENFRAASLAGLMTVPPRLAALGALSGKLLARSTPNEVHLAGDVTMLGEEAANNLVLALDATFPPDFSGLAWRDTRIEYRGASVTTTGTATLSPAVDFKLKLNTSDADLAALTAIPPRLGVPLPMKVPGTGKATADLNVSGTAESWELAGMARLRELEIPLEGLSSPARVPSVDLTLEPERIAAAPFAVTLERNLSLTVGGEVRNYRATPTVQAKVSGDEVPVEPLLALAQQFDVKLLGPGQKLSGSVAPSLELSGPLSEPKKMNYSGTLKFRNLSLALPELPKPVSIPSLALEFNPQRLSAAPFAVALEPGVQLNVAATIEDYRGAGRLAARITGDEVPIEPLLSLAARFGANPLSPGQKLTGRVRPALEVTGPFSEPGKLSYQGTFGLRDASFTTAPLPEPLRISSAEVALTPARISAESFPLQIGQRLRGQASFRLDNYKTQGRLAARVTTDAADLDALLALVRALGSDPLPGGQASGQVSATIDASGALGEKSPPLDISGKAQLSGARVKPQTLTAPLVIDAASLEFTGNRLDVTTFQMAAAGARVRGSLRVDNFDAPNARFDFRGDTLDVEALQALFGAAQPAPPPRRSGLLSPSVVHAQAKADDWFSKLTARGRIEFERVRNGTFMMAPFTSSVAIADQVVTCDPIDFGLYEGGGRGRATMDLRGAQPATEFNGLLRNVDANGLLSATSDSKNMLYGRLGGTVQVRFVGDDAPQMKQSARGKGQLTLVNGRLAQINLNRELVLLGKVAGLRYEGRDTPIEDMTTNFEIAEGWVRTDDLAMRTPDMTATAAGGFSLNDELAFQGTATFTEEASQRMLSTSQNPIGGLLGSVVGNVFVDDQGRVVVPFLMRGTFAQPRPTLDAARLAEMKLRRGGTTSPGGTLGDILDRLRKRKPQ